MNGVLQGRLLSFAGCVGSTDSSGRSLISDCEFTMRPPDAAGVYRWLDDHLNGGNAHRDVHVLRVENGAVVEALELGSAVLSRFSVSALDVDDPSGLTLSFTAVPQKVTADHAASGTSAPNPALTLRNDDFRLSINGIDWRGIAATSPLTVQVPVTVAHAGDGSRSVSAGRAAIQPLTLSAIGSTQSDLRGWADSVMNGQSDVRSGTLELFKANSTQSPSTITLTNLLPTRRLDAFPTDGTRKTIELSVGGFTLQP